MTHSLVWLHEQALYLAPHLNTQDNTQYLHIWDDEYYQQKHYTLKRLVFIYESLCEANIPIIAGNTLEVLHQISPKQIFIPNTQDSMIVQLSQSIAQHYPTELVHDIALCTPPEDLKTHRFFKYWNAIKHQALQHNGGHHA